MAEPLANADERARLFCDQSGMFLIKLLGHGIDGNVWQTNRQSAVKAFAREDTYRRERDCYRKLLENDVDILAGFDVPLLKDYSNALLVVEMSLVSPPCILDFGKAYVDSPPEYSVEALAEAEEASGSCLRRSSGSRFGWSGRLCGGMASIISMRGRAM